MGQKKIAIILALFLWAFTLTDSFSAVYAEAPGIGSPGAALYHTATQQFLLDKNGDTPMFPASTTKMLTGLIILEENKLSEQVTIPSDFRNPGGSHIAIEHGETFTVEQLLYATLVESANDAALALAIYNSGSQAAFADKMNQKAAKLGATNSHFTNPHGLHNSEHYSTAKDMALIAAAAMKSEIFRKIVKTQRYTIPPTNKKNETRDYLRTSNRFIRDTGIKMNYKGNSMAIYDPEVEGIKTGYTTEASNCLVSSKAVNGGRVIAVILGAGVDNLVYSDSKALLEYGLTGFNEKRLISIGEVVTTIKVPGAEDAGLELVAKSTLLSTIPSNAENAKPEVAIKLLEVPKTAIKKGMVLGKVTYSWNGAEIATTDLIAARDVSTKPLVGALLFQADTGWLPFLVTTQDYIELGLKAALVLILWRWIAVRSRRKKRKRAREEKLKAIRDSVATGRPADLYTSTFPKDSSESRINAPTASPRRVPVQQTKEPTKIPKATNQSMHLISLSQMQRSKKSGKNKNTPYKEATEKVIEI